MLQAQRGALAYQQTGIQSASPLELVVALYEAALRSVTAARTAMAAGDIAGRQAAINRMVDIIHALQQALDLERGGKLAADLDGLYGYILSRLIDVTARQDPRPLDEVERLLATLRDGWQQIATQPGPAGSQP
jgi:flagellar protein FliS